MKEVVSKSLIKIGMIVTVILIVIYALFKSYDVISSEISSLSMYVGQTEENAHLYEEFQKTAKGLFVDDYTNRANNIAAILKLNEDENLTAKELKEISYFENVSNIYIVNNEGVIKQSSDSDAVGIDFYKNPDLAMFLPLIESKEYGYYCEFEGKSIITGKRMIYLMVRNSKEQLIQIEIRPEMFHSYMDPSSISNYIKGLPTKWERTILAMDSSTGELIAITENNEQTLEGDNLLEAFKKAEDQPKIVRVNGHWQLTLTKTVSDNLMIVGISEIASLIQEITPDIIVFSFCIFLLNLSIYYFTIKALNKLVLQDIANIYEDVKSFVTGKNIEFREASTKELSELVKQLRKLKEGINLSNEQLKFAVSVLGEGFTGYEYYAEYNRLFLLDDVLDLTGWTREKMEKEVKYFFKQNRPDKGEKKSIRTIIQFDNGKIFRVNRYITHDMIYAIAQDITEKENLKEKLLLASKNAYIDELTKLNNRRKLENVIQEINKAHSNPTGVMLLMDLDNFKRVNDEKGHMEGDVLLIKFADILRKNFRDSDLKVRLGGDEFVVFMPNFISEKELIQKIEKFLTSVRNELYPYYVEFHLSVSIGAIYMNSECKYFEALYHGADSAMYVAKKSGKDGYYINNAHDSGV